MTMSATADSAQYQIPAHVPPELVRPIGLTEGPEFLASPYDFMADLHKTQPRIFYSPSQHAPHAWLLTHYDDVFTVLRNSDVFTTGATAFPRSPDNYFPLVPMEMDPPDHRQYRAVLDPMLSPRSIGKLEGKIRTLANDLIDQFIDKGSCEFTKDFGRPLPVSVFLDLMGLPQDMRDTFVKWAMGLLHSQDRAIAGRCMQETIAYLQSVIEEKKKQPDEGAVSAIVHGKLDGKRHMTAPEVFGFTFFLFIAGLDTVFATLNNIFLWLANNPDRRKEIIETPDNINNVMEELLRVFTVTFSGRNLKHDYELHGIKMKKGDKVTCILPAANYDPSVFENPREVNFHRPRKPTLAFTAGVHSCMGAHLARLEIKISIQEFLRRIPDFQLKPGTKIEYWPGGVIGPKVLPLIW
jgi:cytochrome P450